ncbi:hypothetical protein EH331_13680 [Enterococcus faecalis]|nr:hypothetical protein [Enterococcus faecalis]EJZ8467001.1 hypothetical protein [Enterococcus faecalis]
MNYDENKGTQQTLFVVPGSGKDVRLFFNSDKTKLEKIRLSVNKLVEIVSNGVLDVEAFLHINSIGLITRTKYKTLVKVQPPFSTIDKDIVDVKINVAETSEIFHKSSKDILSRQYIDYYVDSGQQISHHDLYNLSVKNQFVVDEIKRRKKNDSTSTIARNKK